MERIYRLTCGPYYEKQELGYLTEDKLNDYLEELFNSALIQSSIRSHIETLKVQKMAYETQRHHIVQDMNKCLPILQDGKTNPKYKETKKEYRKYERAVIDCKWQIKKIDKLLEKYQTELIALAYAKALFNVTNNADNYDKRLKQANKINELLK